MQKPVRRIDIEAEKKKNVTIAIVIAATGVVLGIALYIGMFVVMFAFPFAFVSFMPIPAEHKEMVSVDGRLLLFTEEVDFKGASYQKEPKQKVFMREFDGDDFTRPVEIEPFNSVSVSEGRIYFFSQGRYRIYHGSEWQEFENAAIGESPKGAVSPDGIWVLSNLMGRPALVLLKEGLAIDIPLALSQDEEEDLRLCSARLVWHGGELHMFRNQGGPLLHEIFDGMVWRVSGYIQDTDNMDIITSKDKLLIVTRNATQGFSIRSFDRGEWSEPVNIDIEKNEFSIGFQVAEFDGKLALLVNNIFFSKKLYMLDGSNVVKIYTIGSVLKNTFGGWVVYFNAIIYAATALFVFVVSAILNRYKLKYLSLKRGRVRFASVFRRFLAYTIDTFIGTLPFGIFGYLIFRQGFPPDNPLKFVVQILVAVGGLILFKYLYFSLFEGLMGKTPGKWICGIMVLRDDFTKCTLGRAFLRNLLRIVDGMFYYFVALISIGATLKWQRLGDLAAGTVVLRVRRRRKA